MADAARKALRATFRHRRQVIPADLRSTTQWKLINQLRPLIAQLAPTVVGAYVAREGELDLQPLIAELWRDGQTVVLPRVLGKGLPLGFNLWAQGAPLGHDALSLPAAEGPELLPQLLLVPCLGYTKTGFRLGYGGGYYDRTLAQWARQGHPAVTVGVAFTELELPADFTPQGHDWALDYIVTGKETLDCRATPKPPTMLAAKAGVGAKGLPGQGDQE